MDILIPQLRPTSIVFIISQLSISHLSVSADNKAMLLHSVHAQCMHRPSLFGRVHESKSGREGGGTARGRRSRSINSPGLSLRTAGPTHPTLGRPPFRLRRISNLSSSIPLWESLDLLSRFCCRARAKSKTPLS